VGVKQKFYRRRVLNMLKFLVKLQSAKQRFFNMFTGDRKGENVVGFIALIAVVILFIIIINRIAPSSITDSVTRVFNAVKGWLTGNESAVGQ
jgi:hypothetical protein